MPYTCQTCAKRKVKCDKATPTCSTCRKGKLECSYQAPPPRGRKRKLSGEVIEKLARYERILQEHGLLYTDTHSPANETSSKESTWIRSDEPESSGSGKLLADHGKSRYIASNLWRTLGDDEMQRISHEEEDEDEEEMGDVGSFFQDPLTGAFMGSQQSVFHCHPSHEKAMIMWKTHVENVEPICKILHLPSTGKLVATVSQQPAVASKADECLLFAIYHFAVFSMTDDECAKKLGDSRSFLLSRYNLATRQALVNATFLKTTEMSVLQSFMLYLIPCRYHYDAHTYWILTGVAVRIAQRMGIHRDGEKLGLPPFEVQMRRRLFYQLLPIDGLASQMSGAAIAMVPNTWDTERPLNVNDDQIWPGMTEAPQEQQGATEMIFCLTRSCIGKYFARAKISIHGAEAEGIDDHHRAERVINEAESEVEQKYIRYCDIINPLHFLTMGLARCGITAMRLLTRLPKVRSNKATDDERQELFRLANKIIDTDAQAFAHASLKSFLWHVKPFFLWGTWDSLIFILTSLGKDHHLIPPGEAEAAWKRIEQIFYNHDELLKPKRALYVAFGRLTLKAWEAHPESDTEPNFITTLRSLRQRRHHAQPKQQRVNMDALGLDSTLATDSSQIVEPSPSSDTLSGGLQLDLDTDVSLDTVDWDFWDQLIHSAD